MGNKYVSTWIARCNQSDLKIVLRCLRGIGLVAPDSFDHLLESAVDVAKEENHTGGVIFRFGPCIFVMTSPPGSSISHF